MSQASELLSRLQARPSTTLGRTLVLLGALVSLAAMVWIVPSRDRNELAEASVWGLLAMVAFAGWGSWLHRALCPRAPLDVGLRVLWGASLAVAFGGLLATVSWFGSRATLLFVSGGVVSAIYFGLREAPTIGRVARVVARRTGLLPACLGLAVLVVAMWGYLGAASDALANPADDTVGYLPLVRRFLETGTLYEPFSERRALVLGGHQLLQAMMLVRARLDQSSLFDAGVCKLILVLLILGHSYRRPGANRWMAIPAMALVLLLPLANVNSASYFSGAVFLLGLARTIQWMRPERGSPVRVAVAVGLVAAAACTLRQNFIPIVFIIVATAVATSLGRDVRTWRARWKEGATLLLVLVLALAPWLLVAYRSEGTFLFPVWLGNGNVARHFRSPDITWLEELSLAARCLGTCTPLLTAPIFFVCGALLREEHARRPLLGLWLGAALGFFSLMHAANIVVVTDAGRYSFPSFVALAIFVTLTSDPDAPTRSKLPAQLAVLGCLLVVFHHREVTARLYDEYIPRIEERARRSPGHRPSEAAEAILRAQTLTVPGSAIALLNDQPALLSYERNTLYNLDQPGAISLPPGMPFFRGPGPVRDYLRQVGVRYVLFTRSADSRLLYRAEKWLEAAHIEAFHAYAAYAIDLTESFEALSREEPVLFEERGLVLIDLGTR